MVFSSVIVEQREKEAEALKSFLFCSLIASLVFHIGVLALGIGKFMQRVSETKEELIEIAVVETVPEIIDKPQEIKNSQLKINYPSGGSRSGGNNDVKSSIPEKTTLSMSSTVIQPVVKPNQLKTSQNFAVKQPQKITVVQPTIKQPTSPTTPIPQNIAEPTIKQPTLTTTPTPEITEKITQQLKTETTTQPIVKDSQKTDTSLPNLINSTSVISSNISTNYTNSNTLNKLRNSLRNNINNTTGNGIGNSAGSGTGTGTGFGNGNGLGNSTDFGNGNGDDEGNKAQGGDKPVAIAPKPPSVNGTKLNRADCIECKTKYPDKARRRGIEGISEVAIDTDSHGNVTFVRLIRSSGDSELDEAAQEAVKDWKLTPLDGGRQGVRASIDFAIKGSQRHRHITERKREKQREASQSKPKITNPISTDTTHQDTNKQHQESIPLPSQPIYPIPSSPSEYPVKYDTENQVDENKTQELMNPSSSTTE